MEGGEGSGEEGKWGEKTGERGERRKCCQDVIHERKIKEKVNTTKLIIKIYLKEKIIQFKNSILKVNI